MLHWNYHGFMSKLPEIQLFTHIYDIICIQESLLKTHYKFAFEILTSSERTLQFWVNLASISIPDYLNCTVLDLSSITHHFLDYIGIVFIVGD